MKRKNTGHITDAQEEELKSKRKKKESLESELIKEKERTRETEEKQSIQTRKNLKIV
jgi:hypothetical protein